MSVIMKQAFPINLGDIPLSWSDNNNLMRVNASFAFTEWYEYSATSRQTQTQQSFGQPLIFNPVNTDQSPSR